VLILATILGSIAVPLAFKIRESLWDKVSSPPERAVAILAAGLYDVYIGTQDGGVYRCSVSANLPCSKILPEAVIPDRSSGLPRCSGRFSVPPAPGKVISSQEVCYTSEIWNFRKYVILDDGSVWTWATGGGGLFDVSFLALELRLVLGAAIGYLTGRIIVLAIKSFRARRKPVRHI
jgi:hypothetical protein